MADLQTVALESLRVRVTKVLPQQILACLDELTDEQIWWRPNEDSNSIGNLTLHLAGSLNHFLNRAFGGIAYNRDRAAEFAERRTIPKAELRAVFENMVRNADRTFGMLSSQNLLANSPEALHNTVYEDLVGIAVHMSTHAGQIVWITKMLRGASMNDIWMKAHRDAGIWKPARK
jgi:hypothetical protein